MISSVSDGVRFGVTCGRRERSSYHETSHPLDHFTHLYNQAFVFPREVKMDSGCSPAINRCTAKTRSRVVSLSMNTSISDLWCSQIYMVTIRLSENFANDVLAHLLINDSWHSTSNGIDFLSHYVMCSNNRYYQEAHDFLTCKGHQIV